MDKLWNKFASRYYRLTSRLFYGWRCGSIGKGSVIFGPILLSHAKCIFIGKGVQIRYGARIEAVKEHAGCVFSPRIEIGDGTSIEQGFHLACAEKITIGKKVAITEYVGIFDIWHSYDNGHVPIMDQPLKTSPVKIGDNSFIGMGAVIQPGVSIGKNCMIGANAVVIRSIPDYSVAVGAPARVIRQFDLSTSRWFTVKDHMSHNQK